MGHQSHNTRLGRRWRAKGLRLNCSRVSVLRLRLRLFTFFGRLDRCLQSFKEGFRGSDSQRWGGTSGSRRGLVSGGRRGDQPAESKLRSFGRSNSFYAEAISDCLEFIKRSSVPVDNSSVVAGAGR